MKRLEDTPSEEGLKRLQSLTDLPPVYVRTSSDSEEALPVDLKFTMDTLPTTMKNFPRASMFPKKVRTALMTIRRKTVKTVEHHITRNEEMHSGPSCASKIVSIESAALSRSPRLKFLDFLKGRGEMYATQQWTVDRCGETVPYEVYYYHDADYYETKVRRADGMKGYYENTTFHLRKLYHQLF